MRKSRKISKKPSKGTTQSRTQEMRELFQSDMSEKKQKRNIHGASGHKKSKHSFKSKSRYESTLDYPLFVSAVLFLVFKEVFILYRWFIS